MGESRLKQARGLFVQREGNIGALYSKEAGASCKASMPELRLSSHCNLLS